MSQTIKSIVRQAHSPNELELGNCSNCFNLLEYLKFGVIYCTQAKSRSDADLQTFRISYANQTLREQLGQLVTRGQQLLDIKPHLGLPSEVDLDAMIALALNERSAVSLEYEHILLERWFNLSLSALEINDHDLIITLEDISERKQSELRLKRMNQDFMTVLESTSDFITIKDQEGRLRYCSQSLADITGHKSWREMIGKRDVDIFPHETARLYEQEETQVYQHGQSVVNKSDPYFRRDGSRGWLSTTKWPMFSEDGKTVIGMFGISRDISEAKALEDELRTMATTDFLTGLASRRDFTEDLTRQVARIKRSPQATTVLLMLDLDFFKRVNDAHGHAVGDAILQHVSRLMRNEVRRVDSVGRIGGEEFAILMPDTDLQAAQGFAERLRRKIELTPLIHQDVEIPITISIGLTMILVNDDLPEQVFARSDRALYAAKHHGRNRVEIIEE